MRGHHREPLGAAPCPSQRAIRNRLAGVLAIVLVLSLTASCAGVPPAPLDGSGIPAPRPVSTSPYQVGAYYVPAWPTLEKWKVLDNFPERMPLLGYDREGDPTVMDWQIKWAVEHGISFFAFARPDAVRHVFSRERGPRHPFVPAALGLTVSRVP